MKTRFSYFLFLLFSAIVMSACNDHTETPLKPPDVAEEEPNVGQEVNSEEIEEFTAESPRLPVAEELGGQLLFVFQRDLYLGQFNGHDAHRIDRAVDALNVYPSPQHDIVVYIVQTESGAQLKSVELQTLETQVLFETQGRLHSFEWSPDGQWLSFVEGPNEGGLQPRPLPDSGESSLTTAELPVTIIVNPRENTHMPGISAYATAWLTGNKLLVAALAYGESVHEALLRIDPQTGNVDEIDLQIPVYEIGLGNLAAWARTRALLEDYGLVLAAPGDSKFYGLTAISPDGTSSVSFAYASPANVGVNCQNLSLVRQSVTHTSLPQVVYEGVGQGAHSLRWLENGSIAFVLVPCEESHPGASLIVLAPDGKPATITDQLISSPGHTYVFIGDGEQVMWIGMDQETASCFVGLSDLEANETTQLFYTPCGGDTGFRAIYWIPPHT